MSQFKEYELTKLGEKLKAAILQRTDIFNPITVVVPSLKIQQWFKTYWLKTESNILMNVNFVSIDQALLSIVECEKPYRLMKRETFKSLIIKFLSKNSDSMSLPINIKSYFIKEDNSIDSIKIYDLANQLSKLYLEYEKDQLDIIGWQKELYELVLTEASNYGLSTISYMFNKTKKTKIKNDELYFFGFINFTKLQEKIIKDYASHSKVTILLLEQNKKYCKEYSVIAAPSKLREIEAVHSEICKLLKDPDVKYSDFLVLAPDISDYEGVIPRVFNQDNIDFPSIPFAINDKKRVETNVSSGLKKLIEIINKKFYTRYDFFNLINNLDIKTSRGIIDEDLVNWLESIVEMKAYRNSEDCDDWTYVRQRVLCSKISGINDIDNNIVELKDDNYIPFSTIAFDDESIIRFVKVVDDLKSWIDVINEIEVINQENIQLIRNELDKWFSIKDSNGFETNNYYKSIINVLDSWHDMEISKDIVPLNTLFYMLIDASITTEFKREEYFTRGITFADFDIDAILSTKYVFFLNASSKEFPRPVIKSELDLRNYDISNKENIENAFLIQYQNANEKFIISYVNKDLKTDEDFFKSSLIHNLNSRLGIDDEIDDKISLDEKRPWSDLFTKREYKNKLYYLGLLSNNDDYIDAKIEIKENEKRKRVKVKEIADFLEEPLMFKAKYLFGRNDTLEDDIKDEYEPFELSRLESAILVPKICIDVLKNKTPLDVKKKEALKQRFNLEHKLPNINKTIQDATFNRILIECESIIDGINKFTSYNPNVIRLDDIKVKGEIDFEITCNKEICLQVEGLNRAYIEIKEGLKKYEKNEHKFLFLYAFALADVSRLPEDTYKVVLKKGVEVMFDIKPSEASEILCEIYKLMHDYSDNECLPFIYYNKEINDLNDLINKIKSPNESPWTYFDDKNMFNYETQLGYTVDNFVEKYEAKKIEIAKLIKFFELNTNKSEVENNE